MDFVYTFGRNVDVDGDEWIDLGPMPADTATQRSDSQDIVLRDDDDNNPFSGLVTSMVQVSELAPNSQPMPELEPEQPGIEPMHQQNQKQKTIEEATVSSLPAPAPVAAPMSKAAKSKEALMAFYLGRAKKMEAKHKKIVVSPTKPVAIRSLQDLDRSARIGM